MVGTRIIVDADAGEQEGCRKRYYAVMRMGVKRRLQFLRKVTDRSFDR